MPVIPIEEIDALKSNISKVWMSEKESLTAVWEGMNEAAKQNLLRSVCPSMAPNLEEVQTGSRPQLYKLFLGCLNQQDLMYGNKKVDGMVSLGKGWFFQRGPKVATLVALTLWLFINVQVAFIAWVVIWVVVPLIGFLFGSIAVHQSQQGSLPSFASYLSEAYNECHDIELVRQVTRNVLAKRFRSNDKGQNLWSLPDHKKAWIWVKGDKRGQKVTKKDIEAPSFDFQRLEKTFDICEQTEWEFHVWRCFNILKTCAVLLDELRTKALCKKDGYIITASSCLVCRKVLQQITSSSDHIVFCPECKSAPYCSSPQA
mmetsp:Transcript_32551/g.41738  ORF Transcript_32551/g.41738 Transcript_32551/m.41738 type:complete len:315 (-) Transcript_32551:467-1411(-)